MSDEKELDNQVLIKLENTYNDSRLVFKKCEEWIIVMQKIYDDMSLLDNVINPATELYYDKIIDEQMKIITDLNNATYYGNNFYIVAIINMYDITKTLPSLQTFDDNEISKEKKLITFTINNVVKSEQDYDSEQLKTYDIKYYKTLKRIFYGDVDLYNIKYSGNICEYYDTGIKKSECEYLNGKRHGKYYECYSSGTQKTKGEYSYGRARSCWTEYDIFDKEIRCWKA